MKVIYKKIQGFTEGRLALKKQDANKFFKSLKGGFIYEFAGKSIIGLDPVLRITGKNQKFLLEILHSRGKKFKEMIEVNFCEEILKSNSEFEEADRYRQKNISFVLRRILEIFKQDQKVLFGLYGAFSYDFVRQFECLDNILPENEVNDFDFFLYDTFVDGNELVLYRESKEEIIESLKGIQEFLNFESGSFEIKNPKFALSREKYEELVYVAKDYCKRGEIVEVVFSNLLEADFVGDPYALYQAYREASPSPYMFYFDFADQQLVGSSPEMMLKVEGRRVQMRPISGTAKRGSDLIEDHENMLKLLCDPKERAELDMLIDLGRNDLSKVCKPGIKISDYRFVEKYSKVMHTIAHLEGELADGFTALDALFASLNAGTLTGAPKVAAMNLIEKYETERRGYYGGTIGYLTFSGEMDTAILIRTAHIKNGHLKFRVGATLLNQSNPVAEYEETMNKAAAFISILKQTI
ncbi:MAG: anthranilate synthase component I family protein [Patescibacteria group bacterium]